MWIRFSCLSDIKRRQKTRHSGNYLFFKLTYMYKIFLVKNMLTDIIDEGVPG